MPGAEVKVVEIMGRGDFEGAGAEFHIHIVIGDHRDFAAQDRQQHVSPVEFGITGVAGVDGHRGIAQQVSGRVVATVRWLPLSAKRIFDIVEVTVFGLVLHFQIGQGSLTAGAPIDNVVPFVNQTVFIEADKDLPHRRG